MYGWEYLMNNVVQKVREQVILSFVALATQKMVVPFVERSF